MIGVTKAAEALEAALRSVDGVRVFRDPGAAVVPPAAIVMPPRLTWSTVTGPSGAEFRVYAVVSIGERTVEQLWDLADQIAEAIDSHTEGAVMRADPGTFVAGGSELPAYEFTVEYPV